MSCSLPFWNLTRRGGNNEVGEQRKKIGRFGAMRVAAMLLGNGISCRNQRHYLVHPYILSVNVIYPIPPMYLGTFNRSVHVTKGISYIHEALT